MTRRLFAGTAGDVVADALGNLQPATSRAWLVDVDGVTAGAEVTDLCRQLDGSTFPAGLITTLPVPRGKVWFRGPDDGTNALILDFGGGPMKAFALDGLVNRPPADPAGDYGWVLQFNNAASTLTSWITSSEVTARALGWRIATDPTYGADSTGVADSTAAIVAAAALPFGGTVWLRNGTYKVTSVGTIPTGVVITGAGRQSTVISTSSATGNVITLSAACELRGLKVAASVTRTSGFLVNVQGNGVTLQSCDFTGYYIAVNIGTDAGTQPVQTRIIDCSFYLPVVAAGSGGISAPNFSNLIIRGLVMTGPALPGTQPDFGIRLRNGDTCLIDCTNVTLHGIGLLVDTPAGRNLYGLAVGANTFFDSAGTVTGGTTVPSAQLSPAGGVWSPKFTGVWCGLSTAKQGMNILPSGAGVVNGAMFTGCEFMDNGADGLLFAGVGVIHTQVNGGFAAGNATSGVRAAGATTHFSIKGMHAGDVGGRGPNDIGINVAAGASDHYIIKDNDLAGNTTGPLFDGGTGTNKTIENNPPFNPRGPLTPPAVPLTTVALTNPFGTDCTVYVAGGTVTAIAIAGTATGMTSGPIMVPARSTITLTYSVAPTWKWFGH